MQFLIKIEDGKRAVPAGVGRSRRAHLAELHEGRAEDEQAVPEELRSLVRDETSDTFFFFSPRRFRYNCTRRNFLNMLSQESQKMCFECSVAI